MSVSPEKPDPEALDAATVRFLRRRTWLNPDLRLLLWEGQLSVAKDWGKSILLMRIYGRWNLRREWKLLQKLKGIQGVPDPLSRTGDAIVMTYLEGTPLSNRLAVELQSEFFPRLEQLVSDIHERGVVHLDLRQRRNILFGANSEPMILDFGAGLDLSGWGWLGWVGLSWLSFLDRMAVLKHKVKYAPDQVTPSERNRAIWAKKARYFWPPNWFHVIKTRIRRYLRNVQESPED